MTTHPLWEQGSTAFWLDPDLWLRTPEVCGRPAICWMHLDDPLPESRIRDMAFKNCRNFGPVPVCWGSLARRAITVIYE